MLAIHGSETPARIPGAGAFASPGSPFAVFGVATLGLSLAVLTACAADDPTEGAGPEPAAAEYVSDRDCAACHAEAYELWSGSHHDLAMQPADEGTVLGDFDDATFGAARFFRDGERFMVRTIGPDGVAADFAVSYVFGVAPLQQYLIELEHGRIQCLTIAWDTERERWFDLYPDEEVPHTDGLHWTGRYQRWNAMCAECHSTDLRKGYDPETDGYATTWKEIDVGCQACHGAGSAHVAWANAPEGSRDAEDDYGLVTMLDRFDQAAQLDACAPCHSRRVRLTEVDEGPSRPFLDRYLPERLMPGYYHADGQVLDEVYVYGSFAQSKMGHAGVTCTDCHEPHSLRLRGEGNGVCTACHSPDAPVARFPTLQAKDYDTPEHHHHKEDRSGSSCVGCHMPETTFMQVDPRRDHSFRIPRPDLTLALGTPNACGTCHQVQKADWATERIEEWFGPERPQHFAPVFAAAQARMPEATAPLSGLALDPETPPIVRATALELLRPYGNAGYQAMLAALQDEDALVRTSALGGLAELPAQALVALAAPLLRDPVRCVRIEAARVLAEVPAADLAEADRAAREAALAEFVAAQEASADMPSAHLNLGVLHAARGRATESQAAYEKALELDPSFLPARFNLATSFNLSGRNAEAEAVLRAGIERHPEEGELYFSLALLLAEMDRLADAIPEMKTAYELMPERPRLLYNLGMLYRELDRDTEAESTLIRAHDQTPEDPDPLHALVLLYFERREFQSAVPWAKKLVALRPRDRGLRELLDRALNGG